MSIERQQHGGVSDDIPRVSESNAPTGTRAVQDPVVAERRELLVQQRSKDYFYAESIGAYVALRPLRVDERVVRAAAEVGLELTWDDEGRIMNITYLETKRLADRLGARLLSPSEYWKVLRDAQEQGRDDVLDQLQSGRSTEWLDVVYEKDEDGAVWMIEHPTVIETEQRRTYAGDRVRIDAPVARPGWFDPQGNIDTATGMPVHVETTREKGAPGWSAAHWKYWSVFKVREPVAAIRGYVTSSGTPSFDCDIPVEARQPVLMLRECRTELEQPAIDPELMLEAQEHIRHYEATTVRRPAVQNPLEHEAFYAGRGPLLDFLRLSGPVFIHTREKAAQMVVEKCIDMLGILRVMARARGASDVATEVEAVSQELFGVREGGRDEDFSAFIRGSQGALDRALASKQRIVFVMGHRNPDSDTVVSSMVEAYRNALLDTETAFIPVIPGSRVPDEAQRLMGDTLSGALLLTSDPRYEAAKCSGHARWILVDHNVSEVQRFATSIIDHHLMAAKTRRQDVAKTWEMAGSTTALISQKLHGLGIDPDPELARLLYGATLMDTENRSAKKITYKDALLMDELKTAAGVTDDSALYQDLMSFLLNTDDTEMLFSRDYKQDWGVFGFAVAKVKGAFAPDGTELKPDLLNRLVKHADRNNHDKNFPLTIVKVADYLEDNETINRERVYLIFHEHASPAFRTAMFDFLARVIGNQFRSPNLRIERREDAIDFWGVGDQLSRKVVAPFLEPIVEAFNEFYYSPGTGLHEKREFLRADDTVRRVAQELGIELLVDREGRVNNITFHEATRLLAGLGMTAMSLSEYWKILAETESSHDEQMQKHLRSPGFVELLDTVILDGRRTINHPVIVGHGADVVYLGEEREVPIPTAEPGLIYPGDINADTGFPDVVQDPRRYGDPRLWRYWSPDAPVCIPTRGHIFLLNQPSFDTKIHPDDALPNLGIRPCCRVVTPPIVEIVEDENGVRASITRRHT